MVKEATRDISQPDYVFSPSAKLDLYREMVKELDCQFQLLAVHYREADQLVELTGVVLEEGDDEAEVIKTLRKVSGTIVSWMSYGDWPEYADEVR